MNKLLKWIYQWILKQSKHISDIDRLHNTIDTQKQKLNHGL